MSIIEEKKALRTFIRKKERTLDPAYKAESSEAICRHILARADAQDGKAGLGAVFLQFFRLCMELLGQRLGDLGSLEQHSHGKNSSSDRRGHPRSYP